MRYLLNIATTSSSSSVYLGESELSEAIAEWIENPERVSFYIEARP